MPEVKKEKQHISLNVCGEKIDVYVKPEEEAYYRKAEKRITATHNKYAQVFKGRRSDYTIALLTLIEIALKYEMEIERNDTAPYHEILARLTSEIEDALNNKQK